jgi:hypothetical protein
MAGIHLGNVPNHIEIIVVKGAVVSTEQQITDIRQMVQVVLEEYVLGEFVQCRALYILFYKLIHHPHRAIHACGLVGLEKIQPVRHILLLKTAKRAVTVILYQVPIHGVLIFPHMIVRRNYVLTNVSAIIYIKMARIFAVILMVGTVFGHRQIAPQKDIF